MANARGPTSVGAAHLGGPHTHVRVLTVVGEPPTCAKVGDVYPLISRILD